MIVVNRAQYLAQFGVPMTDRQRAEVDALNRFARNFWEYTIRPSLDRKPSIWRRLSLLHVPISVVAVPPDADLPRAPLTNLSGYPLHRFKMDGSDRWYYYGPVPSPLLDVR